MIGIVGCNDEFFVRVKRLDTPHPWFYIKLPPPDMDVRKYWTCTYRFTAIQFGTEKGEQVVRAILERNSGVGVDVRKPLIQALLMPEECMLVRDALTYERTQP